MTWSDVLVCPIASELGRGGLAQGLIVPALHTAGRRDSAAVPRFTPHGLRGHAADTLTQAGIDVDTAATLLGHSPEVMLRVYRKATMGDMRDAVAWAAYRRARWSLEWAATSPAAVSTGSLFTHHR